MGLGTLSLRKHGRMMGKAGIITVVEGKDMAHTSRKPGCSSSSTDGIFCFTQGWPPVLYLQPHPEKTGTLSTALPSALSVATGRR